MLTILRAGLFMLLSFGMMLNTIQLALKNLTTVERLWRGDRAYYIALLVPNQATREARNKEPVINHPYSWEKPKALNTISYPLQSEKVSNPPEVSNHMAPLVLSPHRKKCRTSLKINNDHLRSSVHSL